MQPLSPMETAQLSQDMVEYILDFMQAQWVEVAFPPSGTEKLMALLNHFPYSKHHDLHALGHLLVRRFYEQRVHPWYAHFSPKRIEDIRSHLFDCFAQRAGSPLDAVVTPSVMAYLEDFLDPILFRHNLLVLMEQVCAAVGVYVRHGPDRVCVCVGLLRLLL